MYFTKEQWVGFRKEIFFYEALYSQHAAQQIAKYLIID